MSDESITNYRRVRTMEGWAPENDLSTEALPLDASGRKVWFAYNHTRREYVSGAPWPREASVPDRDLPPSVRWLCELRDRLWTPKDTGYQVLDVVIHYAIMDAGKDQSEEQSPGALSRDLEELHAEVKQLYQEVEFWTKSATRWRELARERGEELDTYKRATLKVTYAGGEVQARMSPAASDEVVERVARWACDACYGHGSFEKYADVRKQAWINGARKAIEGEK